MLHLFPSQGTSLHQIADHQYQRAIELAPYRGAIYDRRGDALAISIRRPSLAVNPRVFNPAPSDAQKLARILKQPVSHIKKVAAKSNYFAWLARHLDHRVAEEALSLGLPGLMQIREPARFYPAGKAAAHLIGFTGLDNSGLTGLEMQFDRDLRGQALRILATKDARGNDIFNETLGAAPEKTGNSIYLTIDRAIQEIAEDELQKGLARAGAKKGFVIVSDPHTGRILALANAPGFDPNNSRRRSLEMARNHALLDAFEPGSVTKAFVVAMALDRKKTTPTTVHDCEKGSLRIGKARIRDDHPADKLSTADTIVRSSNICTYKIGLELGREGTYEALRSFGIGGRNSLLGFPGEARGALAPWENWRPIRFANVSFGQGFMTTGLEVVQAMGAIANGGRLMQPSLIDRIVSSDGLVVSSSPPQAPKQVISPATARTMRSILARVVTDRRGSGSRAATTLYTTGGKTGTAQKVDPGIRGYHPDKRIASFAGFAPVEDPHLVVYVVIDEPREKPYYGGLWAAPVFSAVVERTLRYLNVAPDRVEPLAEGESKVAEGDVHGPGTRRM